MPSVPPAADGCTPDAPVVYLVRLPHTALYLRGESRIDGEPRWVFGPDQRAARWRDRAAAERAAAWAQGEVHEDALKPREPLPPLPEPTRVA